MNKVILMGRLVRDPELQQTPQGTSVCRFSIAVNRRFAREGQQNVDFINCTAWRQTAEFICKFFKQGAMIAVTGSIQTRTWNSQDGKKQYATDVIVDEAYFTGSKNETGTANNGFSQAQPSVESQNEVVFDEFDSMGFAAMGGSEDDLPF